MDPKKNDGLSLEDKFPFQPYWKFRSSCSLGLSSFNIGSFSNWIRFFDAWKNFPKNLLRKWWWPSWWWIYHCTIRKESPTKQIQAIHFCGFQAIHFKSKLSIFCGFHVKFSMDFLQPGRRTLLSELSPTGRQCRPRAPQDIALLVVAKGIIQ